MKKIKRILALFLALCMVITVTNVGNAFQRMQKAGVSLTFEKAEIEVDQPAYDQARKYMEEGDYEKAKAFYREALVASNTEKGTGSTSSALLSYELGELLFRQEEDYEEAYELLNSAYVTFRDAFGEGDRNTYFARFGMANCFIKLGDYENGARILEELYQSTTYLWDKMNVVVMQAFCDTKMADYGKAERLYELIGIFYAEFHTRNMDVVNYLNDFGLFYMTVQDYGKALNYFQGAVSCWREITEDKRSPISFVYTNMAMAYRELGQMNQALQSQQKAVDMDEETYGKENIHLAPGYINLARLYQMAEDGEKQKECMDLALELILASMGENHEYAAYLYLEVGDYYYWRGEKEQAITYYEKALEIRKNILGLENSQTISIYQGLSQAYKDTKRVEESIECAEKAIEMSLKLYGRENIISANSYIFASWAYKEAGQIETALQMAKWAVEICDRQKLNAVQVRPEAHLAMGCALLESGDVEKAILYLKKTIVLLQHRLDSKERTISLTYLSLGDAYMAAEQYEDCFEALWKAKEAAGTSEMNQDILLKVDKAMMGVYQKVSTDLSYDEWKEGQESRLVGKGERGKSQDLWEKESRNENDRKEP